MQPVDRVGSAAFSTCTLLPTSSNDSRRNNNNKQPPTITQLHDSVAVPGAWPASERQAGPGHQRMVSGREVTLFSTLRDHTSRRLFLRTAASMQWTVLPLGALGLSSSAAGGARGVVERTLAAVAPASLPWAVDRAALFAR